jgi:hypothetical protein
MREVEVELGNIDAEVRLHRVRRSLELI